METDIKATNDALTQERKIKMKVSEVISKINDIETCIDYLEDWKMGEITDIKRIEGLAEDIENHLDDYIDLLKAKDVKGTLGDLHDDLYC